MNKYSDAEKELIRECYDKWRSVADLAKPLWPTKNSVISRANRMGLVHGNSSAGSNVTLRKF